jgi:MATE family multidrug resistance protein
VVVQVGMMLLGVVDTVMVGRVSATDLAGVALGNLYFFACALLGMGVLFALDPVIAQAFGAGDQEQVARGLQRGTLLAALLGVTLVLPMLPAGAVLTLLRQPPDVVPVAHGYVLAALPGLLPHLLFIVLQRALQAIGRVRPVVATVALGNLVNVLFNWILVYGNWGAPALGGVGSGWASTIARWSMAGVLLVVSWPRLGGYLAPLRPGVLRLAPLRALALLGLPIGAQMLLEFGAFAAIGLLMGWLGTIALAAHQIALNLASLTFMVPLGVAQATAVLVGRAVGRGDPDGARGAAGAGLGVGAAFMTTTAVIFLAAPGPLARLYSDQPEVIAIAAALIPLAGIFQVFDGLQVVGSAVLRGIGDTRAPMLVNGLGFWLFGMPISVLLGFTLGTGPQGLWWGLVGGLAAVALFLLLRIRHRFGGELRRLVLAGH